MMSYDNKEGEFPLTKMECTVISDLCDNRIEEMQDDLSKMDSHLFTKISMIKAKMDSYIILMNNK